MSDIFVSYASEDRDRIMPLVRALEKTGWSVFWDRTIPISKTWREVIGAEIESCRSMIVVWSTTSIMSDWVQEEAEEGKRRRILFPVFIDDVAQPYGFRSIQTANLVEWDGESELTEFRRLITDLTRLLGEPPNLADEAKRKAEAEEKIKLDAERKQKAEEEEKRKSSEEDKRRKEAEVRRKAEEDAKGKAEEAESRRVEEAKRKAEEERQRVEEAEKRKREMPGEAKISSRNYIPWLIGGAVIIILAGMLLFSQKKPSRYEAVYTTPTFKMKPLPEATQPSEKEVPAEKEKLGKTWQEPFTGIEFVQIGGGCYDMGDPFGDGDSDEKPVHRVCVDDYYIGKFEVTQKQWQKVMENNPSYFKGCDDCPVEKVSWNDIQDFIGNLNSRTGKRFRLPTEAEWEYAARSGGKEEKWAGTNSESEVEDYVWYNDNSKDKTHPVGQLNPNGLGLYDMSGNVWEWVNDWYDQEYYRKSPEKNPKGPTEREYRVLRGGSWEGVSHKLCKSNFHCNLSSNNIAI